MCERYDAINVELCDHESDLASFRLNSQPFIHRNLYCPAMSFRCAVCQHLTGHQCTHQRQSECYMYVYCYVSDVERRWEIGSTPQVFSGSVYVSISVSTGGAD